MKKCTCEGCAAIEPVKEEARIRGVAYIAGPYRAGHGRTVLENIRAAEKVAIKYWRAGFAVICPHTNTAFFDGLAPDEVWLEGDLEFVKRSDLIVMMENYRESSGALKELELAQKLGLKVAFDDGR